MAKDIYIKYHDEGVEHIRKFENGDWVDLRAAEDVHLERGEYRKISLGISMKIPAGYEAHIVPRSSTFEKWGIIQTNSQAVIDNSYCGDHDVWLYPVLAMRDTYIQKNDRICQFRIMKKMSKLRFFIMRSLGGKDRGGFGSSGKR